MTFLAPSEPNERRITDVAEAPRDEVTTTTAATAGAAARLRVAIANNSAKLSALRAPWRQLERRATPQSAAQTFAWTDAAWNEAPPLEGLELAVISVWRGEEMILVWPLSTFRHDGTSLDTHSVWPVEAAWLYSGAVIATTLGTGSNEEYSGPLLLEGDKDALDAATLALEEAKRRADVICVYHASPDSAMTQAIRRDAAFKHSDYVVSPIATSKGGVDFAHWARRKSKSFRQGLRYDRRRLAALGGLAFEEARNEAEARGLARWLFGGKSSWLDERGMNAAWIRSERGERLLASLMARASQGKENSVRGYALKLDGAYVAACICLCSRERMEYFITGFDTHYAAYSPGNLLIENCMETAIAAGVDFDLRLSLEPYKLRWMDRGERFETFVIAANRRGAPLVAAKIVWLAASALRRIAAQKIKPALKTLERFPTRRNRLVDKKSLQNQ